MARAVDWGRPFLSEAHGNIEEQRTTSTQDLLRAGRDGFVERDYKDGIGPLVD